jgi:hypothetical protein
MLDGLVQADLAGLRHICVDQIMVVPEIENAVLRLPGVI